MKGGEIHWISGNFTKIIKDIGVGDVSPEMEELLANPAKVMSTKEIVRLMQGAMGGKDSLFFIEITTLS